MSIEKASIINGPYLLSPTTDKMTIAWEMEKPRDLKIIYVNKYDNSKRCCEKLSYEWGPPCQEFVNGCCIYAVVLNNLSSGTVYEYQIYAQETLLATGQFKTLQEDADKIKLVTISDSHLFHTEKKFDSMIAREKPELILHSGDIPFGTGYQREQYEQNWFQKIPDVLKTVPVYYTPGNHDDGCFYTAFLGRPQRLSMSESNMEYAYSFNYGSTHFVMLDSNSWSLFEMNAVTSGLEVDSGTKNKIHDTLKWLEQDLNSISARSAKWKVLVLHHPYTDEFTNKYIVPIVERNKVDLVISGHLHYYVKAISVDANIGAKIMYISQGSLQDAEAGLEKISGEARLLGDFPEVVAMGRSNYGVLEITEDELCYKIYGFSKTTKEDILVDNIRLTHEKAKIEISDVELRRLDNIGHIEVRAYIGNVGDSLAAAKLSLMDNKKEHIINLFGNKDNSQVVLLEPGEKRKISAVYRAVAQGEHEIQVGDVKENIVVFEPTQLSFAHMKLFVGKKERSDCLFAGIEATNNLDREIFVSVPLYINQRIAENKNIFFRAHEKKYLDFCYKFQQNGSYQVSIADRLPKQIQIEGGMRIVPRIHDKSGNGNYALLHGTPKVISTKDGMEVCLENYGDYIEIPPRKDLIAPKAYCGMVWAKVERLARPNEMGHNPLMVRGKSVGWGATYFMRMVIERAGGLKWGICHDITEYSWQGGHASIGKWAQYTMSFDKKKGGTSYCNAMQVAHIQGIDEDSRIRQWEDEPIFIGYSYIGHVIPEIDRPKYFTHLPAKIGQVRFYKTDFSLEENKSIYESPQKKGIKSRDLAVWLDFKDILTVGRHITEWRHPAIYDPAFKTEKKYWNFRQLRTKTVLPLQACLKATIEVSDDGATAKAQMKINLKDGTNYLDLSALPKAQYIRIITEFSAEVGSEGTFVPELKEYQITANNETDFTEIIWSTRTDWERGKFTGAVGFAPVDRLREYPEYTDIIHG